MRYKFRAWHEGYPAGVDPQMIYDSTPGDCLKWKAEGQKIETIMQWTGLTDRNGKEIYEGDVVTLPFAGNELHMKAEIIYSFDGFKFKWLNERVSNIRCRETEPIFHNINLWEILGNKYENSELINS